MTSIINNSNANSALVNTLNASDSKVNPNIYSTKKIYPPAATCYVRTDKASGTVAAGNSIIFNLLKYGVAQQILLCYTKVGDANMKLDAGDIFNVIDRVELLSSSKVIAQLTKYDLLAQFSNLDASQYVMVGEYAIKARTTGRTTEKYVIPLVFGFMKDINTNLNLQFNEPMSIRVKFGSQLEKASAGTPTANNAIQDVYLRMRYKAYNESDFAEIVAENYNQPELNVMSSGFYDESAGTLTVDADAAANAKVPRKINVALKNTDCVNDFYVFVRQVDNDGKGGTNTTSAPEELTNLKFTASGQEIINLSGEELSYTKLAMNGFSVQPLLDASGTPWVTNVYKIQTGLWEYSGGGTQSNTLSLRELNNPIIEAEFASQASTTEKTNFELVVVEDCVKIFSTTSSNGRVQIALSN